MLFILRSIKVIILYKSPKRSEEFILSSFKPVALDVDVACGCRRLHCRCRFMTP